MRAKVAEWYSDGGPKIHQTGRSVRDDILLECVITHPPSSEGRRVFVQMDNEMVTKMLIAFRDEARRIRQ